MGVTTPIRAWEAIASHARGRWFETSRAHRWLRWRDTARAMSEENVEAMRASFDYFNREGYLLEDSFDPEVELSNLRESPLPGPYRGYEGLRQWSEDILEVLEDARFEVEEMIDADDASVVISRVRLQGRARHTRIDIDLPFTIVTWMRDGRGYRSDGFSDHGEALEAAGLAE
jgi:ketosteroid isomerase-like protein